MNAIQLDLFTGLEMASPMNPEKVSDQGTTSAPIINPCIGCDLKKWCGDDDCAKKGYPIDLGTTHFKNLNEMITYFRTHDILGL